MRKDWKHNRKDGGKCWEYFGREYSFRMVRGRRRKKQTLALLLTAGFLALPGSWMSGAGTGAVTAFGAEDSLIEDTGEEIEVNSGADLDELKAAEQAQTEPLTEPVIQDDTLILEPASADSLENFLTELTSQESPTGSDGELEIGAYIREVMEGYGYTVSEQSFHEGFLNENGVDVPGINIIAERGANGENRYSDILIVSTHYDSKTSPEEGDPLANDKSGAAVLLETARILASLETDTDVCFLFLSGEEDGLYGSTRFVEGLEEEYRGRIVGQIHVEQVGYDENAPYVLMTVDGEETVMGSLLRQEGLAWEGQVLTDESTSDGIDDMAEAEDTGEAQNGGSSQDGILEDSSEGQDGTAQPNDWDYIQDQQTSIQSFAQSGFDAVTLIQDLDQVNLEDGASPQTEQLQKVTDILAMTVGRIMSAQSGSLLG